MFRLTIDGRETVLPVNGAANLAGLLDLAYEALRKEGRVACRLDVNGEELSLGDENRLAELSISEISEVAVTSGIVSDLLEGGVDGAILLADAMASDIGRAVALFREGDWKNGLAMHLACVASMESFFQLTGAIVSGVQTGCFSLPDPSAGTAPPSRDTAEILTRLLESQRSEDWMLMADLLEYEVVPNLESWKNFLAGLRGIQAK